MERIGYIALSIVMGISVGYPTYLAWFRPSQFLDRDRNWFSNVSDDIRLHLIGRGLGTMLLILSILFLLIALTA